MVDDLGSLEHFLVLRADAGLAGAVGLDLAGDVALLRSLAVDPARRGSGLGRGLVAAAEVLAQERGVGTLYLLTLTAREFFARLGYQDAARADAPRAIRALPQFAALCPSTSAFMRKVLVAGAAP